MIYILHFVKMVYCPDQFVHVEPSSCPWNEPHLIIMYCVFNGLLYSIC